MNVAQGGTAQANGGRYVAETAVHQHHVRSINSNVRACANSHADVRPGQGGSVVNAVAYHGDTSMLLQLADDGFLAVGQYPGNYFVHASLGTNGVSGALIVAGEHHHTDTHVLELLHCLGTVFLDGICHGNHAGYLIPFGEEQGCFALGSQVTGFIHEGIGHLYLLADEFHTAAQQHLAIQRGGQAVAGQSMKVGNGCRFNAFLLGGQYDGLGKGMLAESFQRNSQMKQICFGAICGNQIRYPGFTAGNGAGFIQSNDLGFACFLQGNGGLKENAVLGTLTVANHNGDGRGQTQGTGAGDDQHADAPCQGVTERLPAQQPHNGGNGGNGYHHRYEHTGNLVRHLGNGGFGSGCITDHADDLGQGGILAYTGGTAADKAGLVDGCGRYAVSLHLVRRNAFAGQGGFIHGSAAFQNDAIHWDAFTGAHHKDISLLHLLDGHGYFCTIAHKGGGLRGQVHQAAKSISGFAFAVGFQGFAHGNQCQNHGGRFKVHAVEQLHGVFRIHRHLVQKRQAVQEGCGGTQCHQRVHVRCTMNESLKAADEEFLVDDHDDDGEQQLGNGHAHGILIQDAGHGPVPHDVPHGNVHQQQKKADGQKEPTLQHRGFLVCQRIFAGCGGSSGGTLDGGTIASFFHCMNNGFIGGGTVYAHGVGQ